MEQWLEDFKQTVDEAFPRLLAISEAESEMPNAAEHWSAKQIIGHLIDSAANNHARFVLGQLKEDLVFAGYDQDQWVRINHYQQAPWSQLVELWRGYNLHLHHLMAHADSAKLNTPCKLHTLQEIAFKTVPQSKPVTLEYLMQDYVDHLRHHLDQIFSRGKEQMSGPATKRIAILISGRGSNMVALADAVSDGRIPYAEVAIVISDQHDAAGLEKARERGIEALVIERAGRTREQHDREIVSALRSRQIDLVCLAGYMRILSAEFINAYRGRILNIHPSLLPAFPGLHAQQQALEQGAKSSGCTVHFVDETLDGGPIILQREVAMQDDDTVDSLSARILVVEHKLYAEAVARVLAEGPHSE